MIRNYTDPFKTEVDPVIVADGTMLNIRAVLKARGFMLASSLHKYLSHFCFWTIRHMGSLDFNRESCWMIRIKRRPNIQPAWWSGNEKCVKRGPGSLPIGRRCPNRGLRQSYCKHDSPAKPCPLGTVVFMVWKFLEWHLRNKNRYG